jgi:hypothetical protein
MLAFALSRPLSRRLFSTAPLSSDGALLASVSLLTASQFSSLDPPAVLAVARLAHLPAPSRASLRPSVFARAAYAAAALTHSVGDAAWPTAELAALVVALRAAGLRPCAAGGVSRARAVVAGDGGDDDEAVAGSVALQSLEAALAQRYDFDSALRADDLVTLLVALAEGGGGAPLAARAAEALRAGREFAARDFAASASLSAPLQRHAVGDGEGGSGVIRGSGGALAAALAGGGGVAMELTGVSRGVSREAGAPPAAAAAELNAASPPLPPRNWRVQPTEALVMAASQEAAAALARGAAGVSAAPSPAISEFLRRGGVFDVGRGGGAGAGGAFTTTSPWGAAWAGLSGMVVAAATGLVVEPTVGGELAGGGGGGASRGGDAVNDGFAATPLARLFAFGPLAAATPLIRWACARDADAALGVGGGGGGGK